MSDQQHCKIMLLTKGAYSRVMEQPQHTVDGIYEEASCVKEEKNL